VYGLRSVNRPANALGSRKRRAGDAALKLVLALGIASGIAAPGTLLASADAQAQAAVQVRPSDWKAIQQVIAAQRAALVAGDGDEAFGYATPELRAQFGDANNFTAMVQVAYPALLTARYAEFLDGEVVEGRVVQPLRLIGSDNSVRLALYTLEKQANGAWRISGCRIGTSNVQAA
jgi:hypothetical protein